MTHCRVIGFFARFTPLLAVGLATSCDTPQKRGLRELSKAGIEPTGFSLVRAVTEKNTTRAGWLIDAGVHTGQRDALGRTPLRIAIENVDLASTFRLLDAGAEVNTNTPDGASVLGIAVEKGETAIVERLLAAGARVDGLMPDGEKILPWSIREGRLAPVKAMLAAGADPHLKDRAGNPILHVAMACGRREIAETLIERGADPGTTNAAGETTVQLALRQRWHDAIPDLTAAGADPNLPVPGGLTPLEQALADRDAGLVRLLLRSGADANRRGDSGKTPLEVAFESAHRDVFDIFLECGVKPAPGVWETWLWHAVEKRDVGRARLLLSRGASPAARGPGGSIPLDAAAFSRDGNLVKLLLDYGSPPGNALYAASTRGDLEMVDLLLAGGLSPNITRPPFLDTPLGAAIRGRHDRLAAFLIEHGADPRARLPEGQPPLIFAIATGCPRTVKRLLESGADPNTPFDIPVSPAFTKHVKPGVLRWSLKMDRNVTPLMLAVDSGVIDSVRHLVAAGAKKSVWTKNAKLWPINFASRRGDVKMMRILLGRDPQREERRIVIRISEQRARMFDGAGNEIFSTRVSTGRKDFPTPTGEYVITNKYRDWKSTIYDGASMPYFQRFSCGDFGMHEGNVPGYPASHGCIRVPEGTAQKWFALTETGDRVNIEP